MYTVKRILAFSSISHPTPVVGEDDFFSPNNTCIHCPLGDILGQDLKAFWLALRDCGPRMLAQ